MQDINGFEALRRDIQDRHPGSVVQPVEPSDRRDRSGQRADRKPYAILCWIRTGEATNRGYTADYREWHGSCLDEAIAKARSDFPRTDATRSSNPGCEPGNPAAEQARETGTSGLR